MRAANLDYLTEREREALMANPTGTLLIRHHASYHFSAVNNSWLCDPKSAGPVLFSTEDLAKLLRDDTGRFDGPRGAC